MKVLISTEQPSPRHRPCCAVAGAIAILVFSLTAQLSGAQQAVPLDSVAAAVDTATVSWLDPFMLPAKQEIPARVYSFELTEMLREVPGSFLFDLGPYGWPHGFSPGGTSPQHVALTWNGVSLNDAFTGRPQYELLPLNSAETPRIAFGQGSGPTRVGLATRRVYQETGQPLTELSYQTSNNGLQKVYALHSQNRRLPLGGQPGVLNLLFSYGGEAADGEYPGSRVKQGRQIYSRLKILRRSWSLEVGDLYNKRAVGAHGGVIPRVAGDFDTIYQRLGASVVDSDAQRQTSRNDVFATLRVDPRGRGRSITEASAGYTSQRSEYRRPGDTLTVRASRAFFSLTHAQVRSSVRVSFDVSGSTSAAGPRSRSLTFDDVRDSRLRTTGAAEIRSSRTYASVSAGVELRNERTQVVARTALQQSLGPAEIRIEASQTAHPVSLIDRTGLGAFLQPSSEIPGGANRTGRASLTLTGGPFDLTVLGSASDNRAWLDYFGTSNPDSVIVLEGQDPLRFASAGLDLGFRRHARRGFYLTAQPTLFGMLESNTLSQSQYAETLPELYGTARLGARYRIFRGDLDLDISVRGRFWTEFTGRTFHTQTGLLTIPTIATSPVESSATLDLMVSGGVRTATLFLVYENFLAGTSGLPGNLLVPVYPLADKRLRFGVFWPIRN